MKGNFKATSALVLLDGTALPPAQKGDIAKWQKIVASQIDEIARQERMTPRRAVAVGLMLHAIKASLPRGQWTPWLHETLTELKFWSKGTAQVNASYYMRLALAFVDTSKPTAPELQALPAGGLVLDLDCATGAAAKLVKKLDAFCGEASLAELLRDHGIKNGSGGSASASPAAALAALPADDNTLLQDTAEWVLNLRRTVTDPDTLKRFTAAQISSLEKQLDDITEDFRKARASLQRK